MPGKAVTVVNFIRPTRIRMEASSLCQLKCPVCPNAAGAIRKAIGAGFLRVDDFTRLLEENRWVTEVELSNYGEIFLNPELLSIIIAARERGVTLKADNGVNLNQVDEAVLEALVKYGFRSMTCSIDGATDETYRSYRVKGRLEHVIRNIRKINQWKNALRCDYPHLCWQFVVFGHNEHEISLARRLAGELGMSFRVKLSWDPRFSPVKEPDVLRKEVGAATREEFRKIYGVDYMQGICHELWDGPQINWDGRMLGCTRNFWGDFGENCFEVGLLESINGAKMRYAREMLQGRRPAKDDIPCATCNIFLDMRRENTWLQRRGTSGSHGAVPRRLTSALSSQLRQLIS